MSFKVDKFGVKYFYNIFTRRYKTFSNRVNETEKPFKDSIGYPSNPLNPLNPPNPSNPLSPSNPPSPLNPPNPPSPPSPSHPPNPRFKDSRLCFF